MTRTEKAVEAYDKYVMKTYPKADILFVKGDGCKLWDGEGREYLDFSSGIAVCSLGHANAKIAEVVAEQAKTLVHVSNLFMNEKQCALAEKLITHGFDGTCFFCNSGAEANEALIKLARKWGNEQGKNEIITMVDSFHGRTLATLAATGRAKYRKGFGPDVQGFSQVPFNDLEALKNAITDKTAAVLMEPVQGEGGIIPADPEYLKAVRELCNEKNILLLFDEVQCGTGRTGTLFAWQNYGIEPDALSMAKAIGNGFPLACMIAQRKYSNVLTPGTHASTFGGTALAAAVGCCVVDMLCEGGVLENCRKQGEYLMKRLSTFVGKYPFVKEIRGKGLMIGIDLTFAPSAEVLPALREKGLIALPAGETVLRLVPALTVTEQECEKAFQIIDSVFAEIKA